MGSTPYGACSPWLRGRAPFPSLPKFFLDHTLPPKTPDLRLRDDPVRHHPPCCPPRRRYVSFRHSPGFRTSVTNYYTCCAAPYCLAALPPYFSPRRPPGPRPHGPHFMRLLTTAGPPVVSSPAPTNNPIRRILYSSSEDLAISVQTMSSDSCKQIPGTSLTCPPS